MEYLRKMVGLSVRDLDFDLERFLPNAILRRYHIEGKLLGNVECIFLSPKVDVSDINELLGHIHIIRKVKCIPVVLVLDRITYRRREMLISRHVPFIVDGHQIYLPFMGTYLQDRCNAAEYKVAEVLTPASQVLLLYMVYSGKSEILSSVAGRDLDFTATTVMRSVRQLEDLELVSSIKRGVNRYIQSKGSSRDLWERALPFLESPVKRRIYIPNDTVDGSLLLSGESALSEMSMLGFPRVHSYATGEITRWSSVGYREILDSRNESALELWRYDPRKLSKDGRYVDVLSLALSLRDVYDERVEVAVDEMMEEFWKGF